MRFNQKAGKQPVLTEREKHLRNYNTARSNLLLAIIFTVVNIVIGVIGANYYFLFSASIPYLLGLAGVTGLINRFDIVTEFIAESEYIPGTGEYAFNVNMFSTIVMVVASIFVVVSIGILLLYFFAWLKSKNPAKRGWMIFALVFFSLDTLAMILLAGEMSGNTVIDILFHIYVLVYLIMGVSASGKLKNLPEEAPADLVADASVDVSGPYEATPAGEEIDPGFTYYENTTSTLNGESVDTKNENL